MNLKAKALLQGAIMVVVGTVLFRFHKEIGAGLVWFMASLVLVGGLFYPPLFRGIERFGHKLARWVSAGLTWGLLAPFYFLCFFPGHIVMSLLGKDPMGRKFPTDAKTYWIPRPPVRSLDQYKKQH